MPDIKAALSSALATGDVHGALDKAHGTYADAVQAVPVESRLPTASLPLAPPPSPFTLKDGGR